MNRTSPLACHLLLGVAICSLLIACSKRETMQGSSAAASEAAAPAAQDAQPPKSSAPTDLEQLATRLVKNANVKRGEIVLVGGGTRDIELLENIVTNVRRVGAFALVTFDSDRMARRSYTDVPAEFDSDPPKVDLALADLVDAAIFIDTNYEQAVLADVPAERRAARAKASAPFTGKFVKNVRLVSVGNELYPTAWQAERLGVSEAQLTRLFWDGVNVDYSELQSRAETIRSQLAATKEIHITTPGGTDLTMNVAKRPVVVSDGIISEQDRKAGGAAAWVFLPAGEVMTTPRPGDVNGRVVAERLYYDGKAIENLTLTFVKGKLTEMTGGGAGFEAARQRYDAADDPNKSAFAFFDLGINPSLALPADNKTGTWVSAGMVTVGIGDNTPFGGENSSSFSLAAHLTGATVTLDGKTVVENGSLKL